MRKKFLAFLLIIFLSFKIVYSENVSTEESLTGVLKYIFTFRKIITVEISQEFEILLEIYNLLLEKEVEEIDREKLIEKLSLQITKFKEIKKKLFSYRIPKDLNFYLVAAIKSCRDNVVSDVEKMIKVSEILIEYIKTENEDFLISAGELLKTILEFSF